MSFKRSYDWIYGVLFLPIHCCILKWLLNVFWSEEITWLNFISIYGVLSLLVILTYFLITRSSEDLLITIPGCVIMAGTILGLFPLFVLSPVCNDIIGAVGTEDLMQQGWWDPLVWCECWWKQMQAMGWIKISICLIAFACLAVYVIKENWGESKWEVIAVCALLILSLWYAPFIMFWICTIGEYIVDLLLLVGYVFTFLSPE